MQYESYMHCVHESPGMCCALLWKTILTGTHTHTYTNTMLAHKPSVNRFCHKIFQWRETKYPAQLPTSWEEGPGLCNPPQSRHTCPENPVGSTLFSSEIVTWFPSTVFQFFSSETTVWWHSFKSGKLWFCCILWSSWPWVSHSSRSPRAEDLTSEKHRPSLPPKQLLELNSILRVYFPLTTFKLILL